MCGSAGGYSPYLDSYPSNYTTPNFLGNKRTATVPVKATDHVVDGKAVAASNVWLLAPAIVGTGAYFFFTFMFRDTAECGEKENSTQGMLGSIVYSCIATAGISFYIYNVLVASNGHPLNAFLPVSSAIMTQILYYAAVYNWVYRMNPKSFTGNIDGNPLNEIVTFIYFSITTFATAGMGDMAPITKTAKILVSLQVLFFVFIFTMGIVFFADP